MPRKKNLDPEARDRLLTAARGLMLDKGYRAVTVDEICRTAGLSKGAFFHYFQDKSEMARAALHDYYESMTAMLATAPFAALEDPGERLLAYLDAIWQAFENPAVPKSCLFGNLTQEAALHDESIREACAWGLGNWAQDLERDIAAAAERYAPERAAEAGDLARYFLAIYEGSLILYKAHGDQAVIRANVEQYKRYIGERLRLPPAPP